MQETLLHLIIIYHPMRQIIHELAVHEVMVLQMFQELKMELYLKAFLRLVKD